MRKKLGGRFRLRRKSFTMSRGRRLVAVSPNILSGARLKQGICGLQATCEVVTHESLVWADP